MKILISKSPWEIYDRPLEECLRRIVKAGYDAVEVNVFDRPEPPATVASLLRQTGRPVIVQIGSGGGSVDDHLRQLEQRYEHGLQFSPVFFNCHTGKDFLSFDDNRRVFDRAASLSERHGVPIKHETHRGRAMFNLPVTVQFLRAMPHLRLTADLSHFFCVHESDLSDQADALDVILNHADHIHARVGFAEGPQVSDPRNPRHRQALDRCMALWKQIIDRARVAGREWFTATPEFGPVGYVPLCGIDTVPVADPWEINEWMRDTLRCELAAAAK